MAELWSMLTLDSSRVSFTDDDLFRLQYFPELERLHSHVNHVTDHGVTYVRHIPRLRHLLIYSPLVTDACLENIGFLQDLQTIDLQGSHRITRGAFDALVAHLPNLVDIYPPSERSLSEIIAAAEKRKQNKSE